MLDKYITRVTQYLGNLRRELTPHEKTAFIGKGVKDLSDRDLLELLSDDQKKDLLTKFSRVCEDLGGFTVSFADTEATKGVRTENEAKERANILYDQSDCWALLKTLSQIKLKEVSIKESAKQNPSPIEEMVRDFNDTYEEKQDNRFEEGKPHSIEMSKFISKHNQLLKKTINIGSLEMVHYIASTSHQLMKTRNLLKSLQSESGHEKEIRFREDVLAKKVSAAKSDLKYLIEQGSDQTILEELVDLLILKMRTSNSFSSAISYLDRHNLVPLLFMITGGVPYFDPEILKLSWARGLNDFTLPDYMTDLGKLVSGGNEDWLEWLKSLQDYTSNKSNPRHYRKLTAFLSSDYVSFVEFGIDPRDQLYMILRVS